MSAKVIHVLRRKHACAKVLGSLAQPQVMLELPNGLSEWPVRYEDGRIVYESPNVPGYAKKLAEQAFKWIDEQHSALGVVPTLEQLLAGPISEGQLQYLTRNMTRSDGRRVLSWCRLVDGMVSVQEGLVHLLVAYVNTVKK